MDNAVRWLWRVAGRKKGYVLALTLIQGASGGLGVLYALLLRNIVDSVPDDLTEQRLLQNLRAMTNMTVIIVTHRKAALGICDRVLRFTKAGIEDVTEHNK